jgi:hypothetical protein
VSPISANNGVVLGEQFLSKAKPNFREKQANHRVCPDCRLTWAPFDPETPNFTSLMGDADEHKKRPCRGCPTDSASLAIQLINQTINL